jgi:hypothetical protein
VVIVLAYAHRLIGTGSETIVKIEQAQLQRPFRRDAAFYMGRAVIIISKFENYVYTQFFIVQSDGIAGK